MSCPHNTFDSSMQRISSCSYKIYSKCFILSLYYTGINAFLFLFQDMDIPYENSMQILQSITSDDVDVVLRKSGNHRLMTKSDCMLTANVLDLMIKELYPNIEAKTSTTNINAMSPQESRTIQNLMLTPKL